MTAIAAPNKKFGSTMKPEWIGNSGVYSFKPDWYQSVGSGTSPIKGIHTAKKSSGPAASGQRTMKQV